MKLMTAAVLSIPLLLAETGRAPLHSVTAVRHWTVEKVTRVAIEVTGNFEYRTDRLHNPERIYFDILNARPRIENRRIFSEDLKDPLVQRIRVAETTPGVTRIVLDLGDAVDATPSQLTNPSRLIIELRQGTPPAIPPTPISTVTPAPPAVAPAAPPPLPPAPSIPVVAKVEPPLIATPPPAPVMAEPSKAQSTSAPPVVTAQAVPDSPIQPVKSAEPSTARAEAAKSARHTSTGENSLIRALGLKINRVVIDPGHGGHDQGTSGPHGLLEKDIVLDISLRLGKLIEERLGAEVVYTRNDDTFIPLEGRTAIANDKKADLFLSIHANSSPYPSVSGIETYYLNFSDSKDALDVASRENASSQKSVFELRDLIQQITMHNKLEESREFAGRVQDSLQALSARNFPGEKNRGVRKAPFVVLIGANMPSVLAEIGFLSNPKEEALLKKAEYRQKVAEALFRGISRYSESLSHYQMALN